MKENNTSTSSSSEKKTRKSSKFKTEIILSVLRGESQEELCRTKNVTMQEIADWQELFLKNGEAGFKKQNKPNFREAELERIVGRQQMEIELLKKKMRPYGKAQGIS